MDAPDRRGRLLTGHADPDTAVSAYDGCTVVFATRHGKHRQVADAFAGIGAAVIAPADLDTDQFGTFSGEIARVLTAVDAARAKTRLAVTMTGHRYALASEASYSSLAGGLPGHEELLLFTDLERGIEILEASRSLTTLPAPVRVAGAAEADGLLSACGFGDQAVIVRPAVGGRPADIRKGITDRSELARALARATGGSADGRAIIEPDLRAMHNPTRQQVLARLGRRLAARLASACPGCRCPGYGRTATRPGLPCAACDTPTPLAVAVVHTCPRCPHETVHRQTTRADPQWCPHCNP
jgi:hypothetical protein